MRATYRARLQGYVHFTARSAPDSETADGEGRLQNASTSGVCFTTDNRLALGDLLELTVLSDETKIVFNGEVVHIEESEKEFIVGVRFDIDQPDTEESLQMLAILGQE